MCLAVIDWQPGQETALKVVANRDEFRHRATDTMHWWEDYPILAGRDLQAGGTWLGFDRRQRFALLTNIRPGFIGKTAAKSRGELVMNFLSQQQTIETFHRQLLEHIHLYGGFNLILSDAERLFWCSSINPSGCFLTAGIYGLSNDALDTPWPKLIQAKEQMATYGYRMLDRLTDHPILSSTAIVTDAQLPDTGLSLVRERLLSAQTITDQDYGTRSRTHFTQNQHGAFKIAEQQLDMRGNVISTVSFHC